MYDLNILFWSKENKNIFRFLNKLQLRRFMLYNLCEYANNIILIHSINYNSFFIDDI